MGKRGRIKRRSHKNYQSGFNSPRCDFCKGDLQGLPHQCKFCREVHCHKHLIPENHNCKGLSNPKSFADIVQARAVISNKEKSQVSSPIYYRRTLHNNYIQQKNNKRRWKSPRLRIPKINSFLKALIFAILTFYLAYKFPQYTLFLWLEAGAWIYLSFFIYKRAFKWANRVNMGNDLSFFGLRILGVLIVFFGFYIGFFSLLAAALTPNSAFQSIPIFTLLAGAMILGAFIAFRTNRRHHVVGIWRA